MLPEVHPALSTQLHPSEGLAAHSLQDEYSLLYEQALFFHSTKSSVGAGTNRHVATVL